jgi:hypothetical protein
VSAGEEVTMSDAAPSVPDAPPGSQEPSAAGAASETGTSLIDVLAVPPPPATQHSEPELSGPADIFAQLDKLDEDQIVADLSGRSNAVAQALVYRFESDGKLVAGLSKRGVDEAARELASAGQCLREMKLNVKETADCYFARALVGRVLVDQEGRETVLETKFGVKRQAKSDWRYYRGDRKLVEDKFAYEKACSKALRNALRRLIPEEIVNGLIERVLTVLPEQVAEVGKGAKRRAEEERKAVEEQAKRAEAESGKLHPDLVRAVQIGFKACGIEEAERRATTKRLYGVESVLDLKVEQAQALIVDLRTLYKSKQASERTMAQRAAGP